MKSCAIHHCRWALHQHSCLGKQISLEYDKKLSFSRPQNMHSTRLTACRSAAQTAVAPHQASVKTHSGQLLDLNFFPSHLPAVFETYSEKLEIRAYTWTDDDLLLFHQCNPLLHIERLANGRVLIRPTVGVKTQALRKEILRQLQSWNEERSPNRGRCFEPPGGFFLPGVKSQRSPQVSLSFLILMHIPSVETQVPEMRAYQQEIQPYECLRYACLL